MKNGKELVRHIQVNWTTINKVLWRHLQGNIIMEQSSVNQVIKSLIIKSRFKSKFYLVLKNNVKVYNGPQ